MPSIDTFNRIENGIERLNSFGAPHDTSGPRRTNSWERNVVIFIESNDDLYVTSKATLEGVGKPLAKLALPRVRNQKDIFVGPSQSTEKEESGQYYVATVKLGKVLKGHRIQRLLGRVKTLYVFELPLPSGP